MVDWALLAELVGLAVLSMAAGYQLAVDRFTVRIPPEWHRIDRSVLR